ncbi:hypothetical protein IFM89_034503 [Coptis chinensis]|uniref:ABC transmembrane type-1 domain-containing protein n=1 Tax=Coptis chinensis TaxID=261450 RepID=A0A835HLQ9_9MAGN|nr:hypothetical protein IFM89_034503 [Coptis chinensis]
MTSDLCRQVFQVVPFVWYMAIVTFPAGILEIGCWMYASERQSTRLRLAFFRAMLSQDIGTFDTDLTTGKIIAGMTSHMSVIQDAIGEKLGHFLSSLATFFVGILIAFICCWQVALLTLLVVPMIFVIGASYAKKMNAISTMRIIYLSDATSMVEQCPIKDCISVLIWFTVFFSSRQSSKTISQIKTVFAFVGEHSTINSFSECMEKQVKLSKREALIKGIGIGMFQSVTFCSWALMVWIGAVAVAAKKSRGGDTIAAVMSILFGVMDVH